MLATLMFIIFIIITNRMKLNGIKLLKSGKVHGIFIIMAMKLLFWISIIELTYIWIPKYLIYVLPVVFIIFMVYVFIEKNLFYQIIRTKKEDRVV
jgi:hypothetical protein